MATTPPVTQPTTPILPGGSFDQQGNYTPPPPNPTKTPATTTPTLPSVAPGVSVSNPLQPSPDAVSSAVSTYTASPSALQAGEQSYEDKAVAEAGDLINAIEQPFNEQIVQAQKNAEGAAIASGAAGTPEGAEAVRSAVAPIAEKMNAAVSSAIQEVQNNAATHYENLQKQAETNAENTIALSQQAQTQLQGTFKSISTNYVGQGKSLSDFQQAYPDEYNYMLHYAFNGDYNAMASAYALAVPPSDVVQSWASGSKYFQLVKNPQTNAISMQSFDLGVNVPTGWTSSKISTTTMMMQDPNNPANTIIYTTNPLTGRVDVTGTGTGSAIAAAYSGNQGTSDSSSPFNSSTPGQFSSATTTVASALGVDPTTPFSDVVSGTATTPAAGIGAVVAAMIKNEGGSPDGVLNNPGNVKYAGLLGQVDSGVKATDGGTFASYYTPQAGQEAIAQTLNSIASDLGPSATLQSVVDKYTNSKSDATSASGLSTDEYGLLENVKGFDPGTPGSNKTNAQALDADAFQYLKTYLNGKNPVATDVGLSSRSGTIGALTDIKQRAQDLYYQATGQNLPDIQTLTGNLKLINGNNSLLNKLKLQSDTVEKNFGLSLENLNENNINQSIPIINNLWDAYKAGTGDPATAQFFAQNQTLQNELSSLLSVKNAAGTTVQDKLDAKTLSPTDFSAEQLKAILNVLTKEASNATSAAGSANASLYTQTDPLGLDPQNPINAPGYKEFSGLNFTDNYDGSWTAPDQTIWKIGSDGNPVQVQ